MSAEPKLAGAMFAFYRAESLFDSALIDAGFGDYTNIGGDAYDDSIEFCEVGNDTRLNEAQQRIVFDAGFSTAFVNHKDGWETHYNWKPGEFVVSRGWRRKRTEKGFEISYWPEGWGDPTNGPQSEWLRNGYMTITPDSLDAAA